MTDPRPAETLEALLTHTEWVRALANRLVHPEHDADDIVQETWVTVLERPPRPGGNLRGWLATVVRNVVRQGHRAEGRRRQREQSAARGETEADTAEVVERAEIHRRLVNTLMKMREPYRTAVLLRFFEGLPPREIAARLGVPAETARSRVQRGVAVLRAQLDDAWGDRAAWVVLLTPLIQAPAVLSTAGGGAAAAASGGALLSAPAKAALGVVVLAAAVGGAVLVPSLLDPGQGDTPSRPPARAAAVTEPEEPETRGGSGSEGVGRSIPPGSGLPNPPSPPEPGSRGPITASAAPRPAPSPSVGNRPPPTVRPRPPRKPARKTASRAEPTVPARLEKEVGRMARLFHQMERAEARAALGPQATAWRRIVDRVTHHRRKGTELLAIPAFWTAVFTHEDYRAYPGRSGRRRNQTFEFRAMGRDLRVKWHAEVPLSYRAKTPIGLVLGLSDTRSRFTARQFLDRLWAAPRPGTAIVAAPEFPRKHAKKKRVRWSDRTMLWASLGLVGEIERNYNIAWDRLFLDGCGDGADAVWRLASHLADAFAGFIIRGAPPPEDIRLADFRNHAFLLIGIPGARLDPARATKLGNRMRNLGIDVTVANLNRRPRRENEAAAFQEVWQTVVWFLSKRRPYYPLQLDWSVKAGHTRRNFWVRSVREIEDEAAANPAKRRPRPNFQVKTDRKKNALLVTTHRILGLEIHLNDAILDLDREVVVVVNGKELCRKRVPRSLRGLYNGVLNSGDTTRIFPATLQVEIPK